MKRIAASTIFIITLMLLSASQALAAPIGYIDPNTGGMIAQVLLVILASLSGFVYFFKNRLVMFWNKVTRKPIEETGMVEDSVESVKEQH